MAERTPPEERGALDVAARVVDTIASRAALGVPGVVRTPGRRGLPRVHSSQSGGRAVIGVEVTLAWPRPAAETSAAVRSLVAQEVLRLAGVRADRVDVAVAGWTGDGRGGRDR